MDVTRSRALVDSASPASPSQLCNLKILPGSLIGTKFFQNISEPSVTFLDGMEKALCRSTTRGMEVGTVKGRRNVVKIKYGWSRIMGV